MTAMTRDEVLETVLDARKANETPDLSTADLRGADLRGADLSRADLRGANLSGVMGTFATGSFGRHTAIAAGGYISIGCERHTYQEWIENYRAIGVSNDYTAAEIERYGAWIMMVTDWLAKEDASK